MDVHTLFREFPMMFQKPTEQDLLYRYSYHPPQGDQQGRYEVVRAKVAIMAIELVRMTPCSPEQSRMLNALDEVMFLANAAIARNEAGLEDAARQAMRTPTATVLAGLTPEQLREITGTERPKDDSLGLAGTPPAQVAVVRPVHSLTPRQKAEVDAVLSSDGAEVRQTIRPDGEVTHMVRPQVIQPSPEPKPDTPNRYQLRTTRLLGVHQVGSHTGACVVCGLTRRQIEDGGPEVFNHCDAPTPPTQGTAPELGHELGGEG